MRARQRESGGRMIECSVAPGRGGVALLTRRREVRLHVIRVRCAVKVRPVATHAGRVSSRQVVIAVHVALCALQRCMCTGQRESRRRVIEGRVAPSGGGVALLTGLREIRLHVVRIRRSLEIFQVAADAGSVGAGQIVVTIHVALRALQRRMRACERESRGRVIEGRVAPRCRSVALLARRREVRLHVIRIGRSVEVRLMAADAGGVGAGQVVVVVDVTLHTSHGRVSARQREPSCGVIECRARPRCGVVALLARLRESRRHVIRVRRSLEVLQVAVHA